MLARRLHDEALREIVEQIDGLLDDSIQASRSLTVELSPPVLYDAGLEAGLEWLARHMRDKHSLFVEVEADAQLGPVAEDTRVLLFNAVRELLFNVVKHAGVLRACVQLDSCGEDHVRIVVSDTGTGFDPAKVHADAADPGGFGLFSIRERLDLLGGQFSVESSPGAGTRVEIRVPRQAQDAAKPV